MDIYEESAQAELQLLGCGIDYEFHKPRFDKMLEFVDIINPKTLLDIGCGWGYVMGMVSKDILVHGLDISPTKVKYNLENGFHTFQGDIQDFQTEIFYDLIICMELLEHFSIPKYIAEKCRKLGKFGIFSTPVYENESEAVDGKSHLVHILPSEHLEIVKGIGKVREFIVVKAPKPGYSWSMSLVETN